MNLTSKSLLSLTSFIIGGFIGASALVALADWSGAPSSAPDNNAAAPINVSSLAQVKTGLLSLGNFQFAPASMSASGTAGKVLTAIDDFGTVGWGTASGGNFGGIYMATNSSGLHCRHVNPYTNSCSCPAGYTTSQIWDWQVPGGPFYNDPAYGSGGVANLYLCTGSGSLPASTATTPTAPVVATTGSAGAVGGGCYWTSSDSHGTRAYTCWGNAGTGVFFGGVADPSYCPTGYTSQVTGIDMTNKANTSNAYTAGIITSTLCIKN